MQSVRRPRRRLTDCNIIPCTQKGVTAPLGPKNGYQVTTMDCFRIVSIFAAKLRFLGGVNHFYITLGESGLKVRYTPYRIILLPSYNLRRGRLTDCKIILCTQKGVTAPLGPKNGYQVTTMDYFRKISIYAQSY